MIRFEVHGLKEMIRAVDELRDAPRPGSPADLRWREASEEAFAEGQAKVHVHSGELRSSGRLDVERTPDGLETTITYGPSWAAVAEVAAEGEHAEFFWTPSEPRHAEAFEDAVGAHLGERARRVR